MKIEFRAEDPVLERRVWMDVWPKTVARHSAAGNDPSILSLFTEDEVDHVQQVGRRLLLHPGHTLFYEGAVANSFGLLEEGSIEVTVEVDGKPKVIKHLETADTFGELPLIVDGSVGGGKREATLIATEKSRVVIIPYSKFADIMDTFPGPRQKAIRAEMAKMVTRMLYPALVQQGVSKYGLPPRKGGGKKAAAEEAALDTGQGKVHLESAPVTILGLGSMLESIHARKSSEVAVQDRTQAIVGDEVQVPQTAVFDQGDLIGWYWGTCTGLKKKGSEKLMIWHLLEEFAKGARPGQLGQCDIVAMLICARPGKVVGSENVQTRLLDKRRLQMIISGAKTNSLCGVIQKYTRVVPFSVEEDAEREYVISCTWSNHSYTTDWVSEESMACFSQAHRAPYLTGGKRIRSRMAVKFQTFIPGNISVLGDHMTASNALKPRSVEQMLAPMNKSKTKSRGMTDQQEPLEGKIVGRDIREVTKFACQQISSTVMAVVNHIPSARAKAERDALLHDSPHDCEFRTLDTMCAFFKVRKTGPPVLLHCAAAVTHPNLKKKILERAREEIANPNRATFVYFAAWGSGLSMLSAIGDRSTTMDFTEFLRMLGDIELLYTHISVTEAARIFRRVCAVGSAEDGQFTFEHYREAMRLIAAVLKLPPPNESHSEAGAARGSDAVPSRKGSDAGVFKQTASAATHVSTQSVSKDTEMQALAKKRRSQATFGAGPGIGVDSKLWGAAAHHSGAVSAEKVHGSPERLILGRTEEGDEEDGSLDESFADEDTEHSQILRQHRARDLGRERLGRLFAQNIVFEKKTEDVELRAVVRGQKHETVTRARHDELARRFEVEREADQQKIQKLQTRKAAQLRTKEDQAHANWEKIEEVATRVVTERNDAAKFLADTREERRAERRKQLGEMRAEAERREGDLKKKVKMLDNHRKTVTLKREQIRDNTNQVKHRVAREKEVVAELYMDYMRTGHLAKPTGLVDLDGDALPAVLEIAARKSKMAREDLPTDLLLPQVVGHTSPHKRRAESVPL